MERTVNETLKSKRIEFAHYWYDKYRSGLSIESVAEMAEFSPYYVRRAFRDAGYDIRSLSEAARLSERDRFRLTAEILKTRYPNLVSEYEAGATITSLRKKYNVSYGAMRKYLHVLDAKMRPRGNPWKKR